METHSEVIPGLYQGGGCDVRDADFDFILTLSDWTEEAFPCPARIPGCSWLFDDGPLPDTMKVESWGRFLASLVEREQRVLVRCQAGLNRSGMVVAATLVELGHTAEEAVRLVRRARGMYALSNPHFLEWVYTLGPRATAR